MSPFKLLHATLLAVALLHPSPGAAQTYPERPVRIIASTAAGGQSDRLARLVAEALERGWGQPVVVEARAGADGMIAAEYVARAPADGYTLLVGGQSNLALVAAQGRPIRYDPIVDFATIGRIARVPLVLAVSIRIPATTVTGLVSIAKAQPGTLSYASTGMQSRLAAELFKASEGLAIVEVPYKGLPAALADLLSARIDLGFFDASAVVQHADAGSLRLLAAAGSRRSAAAPNVPTLEELGVRGIRVEPWYGLVAPAKTPPAVLAKLRSTLADLRRTPTFQQQLQQLGYEPFDDTPEQFATEIASDIERYTSVLKAVNLASPQ
ncbi:MAG TPA: tripartite tricarboxylate transporter substrate binding protein [Casimicrobiaceae bacterium]|nr:tripartite tricarboxylate transporter substrate binding protein [Casimicrobiaceae bacterium]